MRTSAAGIENFSSTGRTHRDAWSRMDLSAQPGQQPGLVRDPQHVPSRLPFGLQLLREPLLCLETAEQNDHAGIGLLLHELPGCLGGVDPVYVHAMIVENVGYSGIAIKVCVLRAVGFCIRCLQQLDQQSHHSADYQHYNPELPARGRRTQRSPAGGNSG